MLELIKFNVIAAEFFFCASSVENATFQVKL